jgi:hypothetical protein
MPHLWPFRFGQGVPASLSMANIGPLSNTRLTQQSAAQFAQSDVKDGNVMSSLSGPFL